MKKTRSILLPILILLLIGISGILFKTITQKSMIQKEVDRLFTADIIDSMGGLSKDYSKISAKKKTYYYYQTVSNLHDALNIF